MIASCTTAPTIPRLRGELRAVAGFVGMLIFTLGVAMWQGLKIARQNVEIMRQQETLRRDGVIATARTFRCSRFGEMKQGETARVDRSMGLFVRVDSRPASARNARRKTDCAAGSGGIGRR